MPVSLPNTPPGIDRELAIRIDDALAHRHAREVDAIGAGAEFQVVADVHGRHQEAQFLGQLAAHAANARQQVAALRRIHQRHQPIAHFQADQVHWRARLPSTVRAIRAARPARRCSGAARFRGGLRGCIAPEQPGGTGAQRGHAEECDVGHARESGPSGAMTPAVTNRALGLPNSCRPISPPMSCERDMRVTMMATAVDSSSAGIWATRPSPMVSRV